MLYELQVYHVGPNRDLERPRCSDALGVDQGSLFQQASDGDLDAGPLHIVARETPLRSLDSFNSH